MFDPAQCPFGNGCAGYCTYWATGSDFRGFDVTLSGYQGTSNNVLSWSIKANPLPWEKDVETTALHEFGHALGLAHSSLNGVVMSGNCGFGCKRRVLLSDDIAGAMALYGPYNNEGFWPSTTTPMQGTWVTLALD